MCRCRPMFVTLRRLQTGTTKPFYSWAASSVVNRLVPRIPGTLKSGYPPMRPLKVLIVDDNRDAADSLALLVECEGYRPFVAYEAFTGLRLAAQEVPDIIIHDIGLPGMSGYDAARRIR